MTANNRRKLSQNLQAAACMVCQPYTFATLKTYVRTTAIAELDLGLSGGRQRAGDWDRFEQEVCERYRVFADPEHPERLEHLKDYVKTLINDERGRLKSSSCAGICCRSGNMEPDGDEEHNTEEMSGDAAVGGQQNSQTAQTLSNAPKPCTNQFAMELRGPVMRSSQSSHDGYTPSPMTSDSVADAAPNSLILGFLKTCQPPLPYLYDCFIKLGIENRAQLRGVARWKHWRLVHWLDSHADKGYFTSLEAETLLERFVELRGALAKL